MAKKLYNDKRSASHFRHIEEKIIPLFNSLKPCYSPVSILIIEDDNNFTKSGKGNLLNPELSAYGDRKV